MVFKSVGVFSATYIFKQSGFPDGGMVTGSFVGADTYLKYNGETGLPDGIIETCSGGRGCSSEQNDAVNNFTIRFSGNTFFDELNELFVASDPFYPEWGLTYKIASNTLSLGYGSCSTRCLPYWNYNGGDYFSGTVKGAIFYTAGDVEPNLPVIYLTTTQQLSVSQVPLPSALGLFSIGIAGLLGISRLRTIN
jgi:hypothetical protein